MTAGRPAKSVRDRKIGQDLQTLTRLRLALQIDPSEDTEEKRKALMHLDALVFHLTRLSEVKKTEVTAT